jgi:hypothetical protein
MGLLVALVALSWAARASDARVPGGSLLDDSDFEESPPEAGAASDGSGEPEPAPLPVVMPDPLPDGYIFLGVPRYKHYLTGGLDIPTWPNFGVGLVAGYRLKRTTRYTYQDFRLRGLVAPRLDDVEGGSGDETGSFSVRGQMRLKLSTRSFDFPWFYQWTLYEVETSNDADLNLRAGASSGWGLFLYQDTYSPDDEGRETLVTAELGLLVDYASLDAFAGDVASIYLHGQLELDLDRGRWKTEFVGRSSLQLSDAELQEAGGDQSVAINQTRFELEGSIGYQLAHGLRPVIGGVGSIYLLELLGEAGSPETTHRLYVAVI